MMEKLTLAELLFKIEVPKGYRPSIDEQIEACVAASKQAREAHPVHPQADDRAIIARKWTIFREGLRIRDAILTSKPVMESA